MTLEELMKLLNSYSQEEVRRQFEKGGPPELKETFSLLEGADHLPNIAFKRQDPGTNGAINGFNRIELDPIAGINNQTIAHETTHSLDAAMARDYEKISRRKLIGWPHDPEALSFHDAYKKLRPSDTKLPLDRTDAYRSSDKELRAFGVGNHASEAPSTYGRPHLDATMATEMAILRDLYKKMLKNGKPW
jgi:hypothetical protein